MQGKCQYAKLVEPSEAKGPFKSKYSIDLYVDEKTMSEAHEMGLDTKVDKKSGKEFIRFWTNGTTKSGEKAAPVKVVDAKKHAMSDDPGNGSVVNVQFTPVEWEFAGKTGIFGALSAIQVIKLIPKVADEFGEEEGYVDGEAVSEFDDDVQF